MAGKVHEMSLQVPEREPPFSLAHAKDLRNGNIKDHVDDLGCVADGGASRL